MNIDIHNFGNYRLTSHGGRRHDLFNRDTDRVFSISRGDYASIMNAGDRFEACRSCETTFLLMESSGMGRPT